jgi:hypothetical protein
MGKFTVAIGDLRDLWQQCTHTVTLCAVVKEKRFWIYRSLIPAHDLAPDLSFDYQVRGNGIVVRNAKGWDFEPF